jgi:hypothetical protein
VTRTMADATHVNVHALIGAGFDLVAGYVTGTPPIRWTPADWALFPPGQVTIDQGYGGFPVLDADVRDVETGAWTVADAVSLAGWTVARPTIYCSLATLPQLEAAGWRGDVWAADWTGTPPAVPPPMPPGMTCVAVQYTDQGGGGAYDLSVIFDPTWPQEAFMTTVLAGIPGAWLTYQFYVDTTSGAAFIVGTGADGHVYWNRFAAGAWQANNVQLG